MDPASAFLDLILRAAGPGEALRRLDDALEELQRQRQRAESVEKLVDLWRGILAAESFRPGLRKILPADAPVAPPAERLRSIGYLGRGVSGRLGDHRLDAERLARNNLPVIDNPTRLADLLGVSVSRLRWLAFHAEVATRVHYVHFEARKKSGGFRTLSKPLRQLAAVQRWIFEKLLAGLSVAEACHGFGPGRSIVSNAARHAGQGIVVTLDLEGFFPSISFPRVRRVFERLGYSPAVSTVLALLCTECPRREVSYFGQRYHVATGPRALPQGACTSPALANQVALKLDRRLTGLAGKLGLIYSRYADDLTFSGPGEFEARLGYLLDRVEEIALDEGFSIQQKKTRILRKHTRQTVTGLVVNDRPGVVRREVKRLRAILHQARHTGLAAQNREGRPNFRAWLLGKIAYVQMARPEVGAKLRAALESLREE
jgi:RNA-directed DNA polymerase